MVLVALERLYSFEDIQSYVIRLHFNAALTLISNGLAAFLVIQFSTKSMGKYKYYILLTIFTSFLMDFHIAAIYIPYPLFPIPGFCGAGLFKDFGYFWGECLHFYIMHMTLSFVGISIAIAFLYQYHSIQQNVGFFHSARGVILMFFIAFIYPLPPIFLLTFIVDRQSVLEYVQNEFPHVYEFFISAPCNGAAFNKFTIFYLITCVLQIVFVYGISLFTGFKIQRLLLKLKNKLSIKTIRVRKQFLLELFLQLLIPFIFIVVPIVALMSAVILKIDNIKSFSQIAFQILSLHSCFNALTIILVIKPYRLQLKRCFGINFCFTNRSFPTRSLLQSA